LKNRKKLNTINCWSSRRNTRSDARKESKLLRLKENWIRSRKHEKLILRQKGSKR
jgi:hypothetical protein